VCRAVGALKPLEGAAVARAGQLEEKVFQRAEFLAINDDGPVRGKRSDVAFPDEVAGALDNRHLVAEALDGFQHMSRQEDRSKKTVLGTGSLPTAEVEGSAKTLNPYGNRCPPGGCAANRKKRVRENRRPARATARPKTNPTDTLATASIASTSRRTGHVRRTGYSPLACCQSSASLKQNQGSTTKSRRRRLRRCRMV